jgi:ribonuclease VapC
MFVDASALTAVELEEPDNLIFADVLDRAEQSLITSFVMMETGLALMRGKGITAQQAHHQITQLISYFRIETVELTPAMIMTALQAYERYGKGRKHPAKLNMGDCLSYAAARTLGVPLLFKGEDFARTDIRSALR